MNRLFIEIKQTGEVAEVGTSTGNEMIGGGFAVEVDGPKSKVVKAEEAKK